MWQQSVHVQLTPSRKRQTSKTTRMSGSGKWHEASTTGKCDTDIKVGAGQRPRKVGFAVCFQGGAMYELCLGEKLGSGGRSS